MTPSALVTVHRSPCALSVSDEAVEQVQGDQCAVAGVRGCGHGEGGLSERAAGGPGRP